MARTSAKAKKQRQEANRNRDKVEEPAESLPSDNQENIENGAQKEKKPSRKTISKTEEEEQEYVNDYENDVSDSEKRGKKRGKVENSKRKEKKVKRDKSESGEEADEEEAATDTKDYEVEKIVEVHHKKNGKREFLIRWKGFSSKDDTWEPEENLSCPELINRFMAKVDKAKNVTVRELREQRPRTQRFTPTVPGVRTSQRNQGKARTVFYTE